MSNSELSRQETAIRELIRNTGTATDGDIELQSHWAKYICVLTSGFVENSLQVLYSDFVRKCTPAPVAKFATEKIKEIQNPRPERFIKIATDFKEDWGMKLRGFFELDGRDEAINAIMNARHKIAHGKHSDISIHRISEYFEKAVEIADFIEKQLITK